MLEQLCAEIQHTLLARTLQSQIYFPVFTYLADVTSYPVARMQGAEHLAVIKKSAVASVHDSLQSQVGFLPDEQVHGIACVIGRELFGEITFHLGTCHDATGFVVQMYMNDISVSFLHLHLLLSEGYEEVFLWSPMQEGTEIVYPGHFQISKVAHLCQGHVRGGHYPFLLVEIEEHIYHITDVYVYIRTYLSIGEKYLSIRFATFQVESEVHLPIDFQCADLSYL